MQRSIPTPLFFSLCTAAPPPTSRSDALPFARERRHVEVPYEVPSIYAVAYMVQSRFGVYRCAVVREPGVEERWTRGAVAIMSITAGCVAYDARSLHGERASVGEAGTEAETVRLPRLENASTMCSKKVLSSPGV
ncbi:hypothetical protein EDB92DRAFT_1881046 [Lactarius akahatsu]|uniref:Uncharacterized protein n=1 Tax=Lactarius akahatsu TaxID=416441 RepID=A0AAD4LG50_9AGAM|nr:hypothetical protein EDB92DRAFT_1881046 [Lactarius akahatsu]